MKKITFLLFVTVNLMMTSCEKEPEVPNDEELITTLTYTLTPTSGGSAVEFKFQDLDGDGGNAAITTEGTLSANTTYNAEIKVLNESETPTEDITEEVMAEADEHQFFFVVNNALMTVAYNDTDPSGNPIGLKSTVTTTMAGTSELTISLKHQPKKPNDGTTADAGGETDIEVNFSVEIQ